MKPTLSISTLLSAALLTFPLGLAAKDISKKQVPQAVLDAFEKAYPNAKDMEYEEEQRNGKTYYEVEYQENKKQYDALYTPDGTLIEKEEEMALSEAPEAVIQAVKKEYPSGKLKKKAEKVMDAQGNLTSYEIEVKEGGKEWDVYTDVNGKIIRKEED
jgi:hypothetical protein